MAKSITTVSMIFLSLCLCAFAGAGKRMRFPPPATETGHNWETCEPEAERVDSVRLQLAMDYLEGALDDPKTPDDKEDRIKFACLIRNGRMIWPNSSTPRGQGSGLNTKCQIYSATKTFGTGVLGLLIDQGLADLDMPANPIIAIDLAQEDGGGEKEYPVYDMITLRHLATFTDGYRDVRPKWPDPGMYYPFDPEPPLFAPPGSKFAYNSSSQLLSYCMTKLIYNHFSTPPYSWSKEECNLDHYFEEFIASRIGIARSSWRWSNEFPNPGEHDIDLSTPEGLEIRPISQSMFMSATALARWGHLFLNRGNWGGKQIISRSFVDEATTVRVPAHIEPHNRNAGYREGPGRYGYMWWINGYGGWTPNGPKDPPVLRFPDVPHRAGPTTGVYAAQGDQTNLCVVIHTLNAAGVEVRANMVFVRASVGVSTDGRHSTPGRFTSAEYNTFLKMLGDAILPQVVPQPLL
ncbi:MAG: serine hydrolase domain-containing protein [Planctomycetota bacterium]